MLDIKKEIHLFFTALMFYTRFPIPNWVPYEEENQAASARYFPLVGVVVGALAAFVFWLTALIFVPQIAILLAMAAAIWITGALHEDGFADMCDGFGGGWTKERILEIMKDSQLGTFGVLGLILLVGLKFLALTQLPTNIIPLAFIAGHTLSRAIAITFLNTHAYARSDDSQKAGAMVQPLSVTDLIIVFGTAAVPLIVFGTPNILLALIPLAFVRWYLGRLFTRKLGGYTGDCLGAAQQVVEVVFYLVVGAILIR